MSTFSTINPTRRLTDRKSLDLRQYGKDHEQMGVVMGVCLAIGVLCSLVMVSALVAVCFRVLLWGIVGVSS